MKNTIYLFIFSLFTAFAQYAQTSPGVLEVTGTAICEELPSDMLIAMPINIVDSTYAKCSKRLNGLLNDLKEDLTSKGFSPDVVTTKNYSIAENFEYRQGQRIRSGFKGQVTVTLEQEYESARVDAFLKTAEKFRIQYSIGFLLSEEQKEKLSKEAMIQAVEDATRKAKVLSEASGIRLDRLSKISYLEQPGTPGPLVPLRAMTADTQQIDAEGLNLFPGKIGVKQSVFMVWNITR